MLNQTRPARPTYADLEIRIMKLEDAGYPVEITFSGEQEFPRGYLQPNVLPWVPSASPEQDGARLFELLFADDPLKKAWATGSGQNPNRRIRLRIDESVPELHTVPWELLRDGGPGQPALSLAAAATTPFSRYLPGAQQHGSPVLDRPVKLLVAIANPANLKDFGLSEIDVEAETQSLQAALTAAGGSADDIEMTVLPQPVTLPALEAALKQGYHALHFIGHGMYQKDKGHGYLALANSDNQAQWASDTDFAEMLARLGQTRLRLVFLASCQTASRSPADAFRGFAPSLVAAGIPAVLAMQDLVPVITARDFAGTFYHQLAGHGQVDLACNEARSAVLTAKLPGAAIPVLFMRLRDGKLFGQRGQVLGDRGSSFWNLLLRNIASSQCTPFLGPGVTEAFLPGFQEMAAALAEKYNYPFSDTDNLPRVTQFVGAMDNGALRQDVMQLMNAGVQRRLGLKPVAKYDDNPISQTISAIKWPEFVQKNVESEIHHQLADLNLPLYITTNYDNLMALALEARGRKPRRIGIPWRDALQPGAAPAADLDPPASPEEPVILHLFGTDEDIFSMVLMEDDYLDYMACIARDGGNLLPASVAAALAKTTLLFLGFQLNDLDMKVILRGLLKNIDLARWKKLNVAVQVEASQASENSEQSITDYLVSYFGDISIKVYWGSAQQFVADLHSRWEESNHG